MPSKETDEIWEFEKIDYFIDFFSLKQKPKGNRCLVKYYKSQEKADFYFMYDKKIYTVEVKKRDTKYEMICQNNRKIVIIRFNNISKNKPDEFYVLTGKKSEDIISRRKKGQIDGYYVKTYLPNEKMYQNVDVYLEELRQQYEFDQQEEEAFRKDPPNMMKGGK